MNRERLLYIVLAVIGLGALTAYLVACRPSWSPDGSKVLFPYFDRQAKKAGIALFDKNTGKTRSIFSQPVVVGAGKIHFSWPWAQWDRSGRRVIVVWGEGEDGLDKLHVHVLRVGAEKPDRTFVLPDTDGVLGIPLPEVDGGLFAGGKLLTRMDLETGKVRRRKLGNLQGVVLVGHENQVFYCGQLRGSNQAHQIGTVDCKKLTLRPVLQLREEDVGDIFPLFAVAQNSSAIAIPSRKAGKYHLLVVANGKLEKSIPLELPSKTHRMGNLQWSPDGKTVYGSLAAGLKDPNRYQLGIAEITADTGAIRVTPLLRVRLKDGNPDILPMLFQIALSPDGNTVAAASTYLQLEDEKDRALYLVDLTRADRKVTKIPAPIPRGAEP